MGLQINTNVQALNAYRNLTGTQGSMQTSLERLSSGLRINRAADDAAGLAISEKLRSQVNGLNQAQANAQDGISLIQTAEGALNETHAILQRMRTLAVQSASDSNTDADRAAIQKEITALVKEIDSTTERTQFNGMNLLDGTFKGKALQIGANGGQVMDVAIQRMDTQGLNLKSYAHDKAYTTANATTTAVATASAGTSGVVASLAKGTYQVSVAGSNYKLTAADGTSITTNGNLIGGVATGDGSINLGALTAGSTLTVSADITSAANGSVDKTPGAVTNGTGAGLAANTEYEVRANAITPANLEVWSTGPEAKKVADMSSTTVIGSATNGITLGTATAAGQILRTDGEGNVITQLKAFTTENQTATTSGAVQAGTYSFQLNKDQSGYEALRNGEVVGTVASNGKSVNFYDGSSATLKAALTTTTGDNGFFKSATFTVASDKFNSAAKSATVDLSSRAGAVEALKHIDQAIKSLSDQRADLGALQNRLDHTIKNLGVSSENLAASESRIRDTDMAKEMTNFTRSQILQQAGVSMLAQANQSSQSVLKLLG